MPHHETSAAERTLALVAFYLAERCETSRATEMEALLERHGVRSSTAQTDNFVGRMHAKWIKEHTLVNSPRSG